MNSLKLRRLLITVHLWLAGLLAPAFLVVAISGGFYLTGVEAKTETTPIELPAGTTLDDYQQLFGCPVLFEQPCNALLVPLDYLGVALRQADANLLRTLSKPQGHRSPANPLHRKEQKLPSVEYGDR